MNADFRARSSPVARLVRYQMGYWKLLFAAFLCVVFGTAAAMMTPWLLRKVVDEAVMGGKPEYLVPIAVVVVAASILTGAASYGQVYLNDYVAQRVIYDLRNRLYNHLQRLSFSYYDQVKTGELMSRLTADVETLRRFLSFGVLNLVKNTLTFAAVFALLFSIDPGLTLLSLTTVPLLGYVIRQFGTRVRPAFKKLQEQVARLTSILQENISGIRVVKAFGREGYETDKFSVENRENLERNIAATRLWAFYFPFMNAITAAGTILVIWYGGRRVMAGEMSLGALLQFEAYFVIMVTPMRMMGWLMNLVNRASASSERIFEVLDTAPEIVDSPGARPLPPVKGAVSFQNVSFGYKGGPAIIEHVSFDVEPGQRVAIIGPTGSGKSTIINLIPRFYECRSGRILIDGHDISRVTLESLRSQVGLVLQETFLFSASIRDNIAYGRIDASAEEVIQAAKTAQIHDFIETLPDGYDTIVGERGIGLSGGQKQRIAIARALIMNPRILIMDDSTSSVDAETELKIRRSLDELMRGRTCFIIAQRPSTVRKADKVLLVQGGRVIEGGPELLGAVMGGEMYGGGGS